MNRKQRKRIKQREKALAHERRRIEHDSQIRQAQEKRDSLLMRGDVTAGVFGALYSKTE